MKTYDSTVYYSELADEEIRNKEKKDPVATLKKGNILIEETCNRPHLQKSQLKNC